MVSGWCFFLGVVSGRGDAVHGVRGSEFRCMFESMPPRRRAFSDRLSHSLSASSSVSFSALPRYVYTCQLNLMLAGVCFKTAHYLLSHHSFGFQAKTTVDSFLPVSLVVHNSSAWPVDVIVEVTSTCEGREEEGSRSWGDDGEDDSGSPVMWSGMPRCVVIRAPQRGRGYRLLTLWAPMSCFFVGFGRRHRVCGRRMHCSDGNPLRFLRAFCFPGVHCCTFGHGAPSPISQAHPFPAGTLAFAPPLVCSH